MQKIVVKVKKLSKDAKLPEKQHETDAGYDLYSNENAVIAPGEYKIISTGIAIELPRGIEAQIRPRSGLALKYGLTILNAPGTVDSGYRGEIKIILLNLGKEAVEIKKGQRIAQMVFNKIEDAEIKEVKKLSKSDRNEKGFGSTGV